MTEYQKMLGGQLYNAQDGELQAMHRTAMELCHALNQLNPNQKEEARALLQQLLGRTGEHFTIKSTFWCDYGRHITIGENFFCNYNCVMLDCAPITFGNNVMVAPNCGFYTAALPSHPHPLNAKKELRHMAELLFIWPASRRQRPAHPPGPSRRGGTGPGHRPGACSPAGRRRASP